MVPGMRLRYRCILVDHDDTAVDSTAAIHYPAHLDALAELRPGRTPPTREQWLLHNFHGIMDYLQGDLGLTDAEMERELAIWRRWTSGHVPPFFPGFLDLLRDYRQAGGRVVVISHSEAGVIESHYRAGSGGTFIPDIIFGWEPEALRRKPSPWPVQEALGRLHCDPKEALVVDDLKPGVLMARAAGVDVAAAGWSHRVEEIERYMRAHAVAYCATIAELRAVLHAA